MIKKRIEDQLLAEHLSKIAEDGRQVMLLADGQIRLTGLGGTTMVNQMRANHGLGILSSRSRRSMQIWTNQVRSTMKCC